MTRTDRRNKLAGLTCPNAPYHCGSQDSHRCQTAIGPGALDGGVRPG